MVRAVLKQFGADRNHHFGLKIVEKLCEEFFRNGPQMTGHQSVTMYVQKFKQSFMEKEPLLDDTDRGVGGGGL